MWPISPRRRRWRASTPTRNSLPQAFWPGPLTLVLPKAAGCPVAELATAGLDSIAVRVPHHAVAQKILAAFGGRSWRRRPIAPATSRRPRRRMCSPICAAASISSSTAAPTPVGVESTIIACLGEPVLLRPGGVPRDAIERALGRPLADPPPAIAADGRCAARARHAGLALRAAHAAAARRRARRGRRSPARFRTETRRGRRERGERAQPFGARRPRSKRRPICSRTCARWMPPAPKPSP